MILSQKCQYALRAVFELAKRDGQGAVKIGDIAEAQAIPAKFLEAILNQVRLAGFVNSRRGKDGGYMLAKSAEEITVGDIIHLIEGPISVVDCVGNAKNGMCEFGKKCVFFPMWEKARKSLDDIFNETDFKSLVKEEIAKSDNAPMYCI